MDKAVLTKKCVVFSSLHYTKHAKAVSKFD